MIKHSFAISESSFTKSLRSTISAKTDNIRNTTTRTDPNTIIDDTAKMSALEQARSQENKEQTYTQSENISKHKMAAEPFYSLDGDSNHHKNITSTSNPKLIKTVHQGKT